MKIMISSMAGGDQTDSRHFRNVLSRLGHQVFWTTNPRIGVTNTPGDFPEPGFALGTPIEDLIAFVGEVPDLFLYLEPLGLIPEGMERAPFPTACVLCDMHNSLPGRLTIANFFDHVISYQRNYVTCFTEHPASHVNWFPIALDLETFFPHTPVDGQRELDISFIGKLDTPEREEVFSMLAQRYKTNPARVYLQREIPEIYSQSKIVLNIPRADDLNYRVFEALSSGSLLLTKRTDNGMDDLFVEGVHYAAFSTLKELCEKVDHFLAHESERIAIASAGLEEFKRHHGLETRVKAMLEKIFENRESAAPVRNMSSYELDRAYTRLYEYRYQLDPILRRVGTAKQENRAWLHMMPSVLRMVIRYVIGRLPVR